MTSQADAEKALNQLIAEAEAASPRKPPNLGDIAEPAAESPNNPAEPPAPRRERAIAGKPHVPRKTVPPQPTSIISPDIVDESDLQSKYISIFIDETELSLDNLTDVLLALEQDGHRAAIEQLLMTSHRIKGSAASIGLNHAAKLAHLMEDLMQDISCSGKSLTPKITDALLACIDGLRTYVDSLKTGQPANRAFQSLGAAS